MRLFKKHPVLTLVNSFVVDSPLPSNISYFWNFGSLLGVCLVIQIVTGIFLAMHYTGNVELAFNSVEHIMRDVNNGWLLRYAHANGASMFFIMVYLHIGRGIYYGSYNNPRGLLWFAGVLIFFIMMGTAFIGYVLPWGQMSFWGATVITNMASAVPYFGTDIVQFVWGGFAVDNPTLNRFFSLHYLLPFLLAALVVIHLIGLHEYGSNNPFSINSNIDKISFHPYFSLKDMVGFIIFALFFSLFLFYYPNLLGHSDNYIPANPLVTPPHIVPEWYFLPFYAILRSIPNKLLGVIAMIAAIFILLLMPILHSSVIISSSWRPFYKFTFWIFVANFFLLGAIGGLPVEEPYLTIGGISAFFYFFFFLFVLPFAGHFDNFIFFKWKNK